MPERTETESRKLLRRLRDTLAERGQGQERLDRITHLIADSIGTEVCSICLLHDPATQEPCATEGLKPGAVHKTRMKLAGGLAGRVTRTA
jgi:phosphotransferase system enzyme I (PtsP)